MQCDYITDQCLEIVRTPYKSKNHSYHVNGDMSTVPLNSAFGPNRFRKNPWNRFPETKFPSWFWFETSFTSTSTNTGPGRLVPTETKTGLGTGFGRANVNMSGAK